MARLDLIAPPGIAGSRRIASSALDFAGLVLLGVLMYAVAFDNRVWYDSLALPVALAGVASALLVSPASLRTRLDIPIAIYVVASLISWAFNRGRYPLLGPGDAGPVAEWQPALHTVTLVAYFYAAVWLLRTSLRLRVVMVIFTAVVSWFGVIASSFSLLVGLPIATLDRLRALTERPLDYPGLMQWTGYYPISLLFVLAFPFPIAVAMTTRSMATRVAALAVAAVLGMHLYVIQSRLAFTGVLAMLLVITGLASVRLSRKAFLIVLAGIAAASLAVLPLIMLTLVRAKEALSPSNMYAGIWSEAFRTLAENPILGVGPDHFAGALRERYEQEKFLHAHNMLLHVSVERGLIAAAAFGSIWISLFSLLWSVGIKSTPAGAVALGVFCALVGCFARAQGEHLLSGLVVSGKVDYVLWTLFAVAVNAARLCVKDAHVEAVTAP